MALIVISVSDTQDGQVGVSMIAEPAMSLEDTGEATPAQAAALRMINAMTADAEQAVVTLNE
jgi:hypothetical protein